MSKFCGICLETFEQTDDCVAFKSTMKTNNLEDELTYLDCFELVTHLNTDINAMQELYLCEVCRNELENSFKFLRKAEKSQRVLNEKIELERKQTEQNQDVELSDLIEETVSDDFPVASVLTDAMLSTNSNDYLDAFSEPLDCESVHLSPLDNHEEQLILPNITVSKDVDIKFMATGDEKPYYNESVNEKYSCSLCSKIFNTDNSLKNHLKYHKRKKVSMQSDACEICKKKFSTVHYLKQHMVLVHATSQMRQQFKCDQCEKIYFTKSALKNHKRIHSGETISCTECHKSFVTQYDLKIHMRFHTRDYPYVCDVCNRKFAIKGHLRTHMWEHQGLKLQCEICYKLFSSTKALSDHSFVHTGDKPYPCSYCKKSYPSKQKYKAHLLSAHEIVFDELNHAVVTIKAAPRRKNLTLVQAGRIIKQEFETKNEIETFKTECSFDDFRLEVG